MLQKFYIISLAFLIVNFGVFSNELNAVKSQKSGLEQKFWLTTLAQKVIAINSKEIAIGRWDGTITIGKLENTFFINQVIVSPHNFGVTMLERWNDSMFVSSNSHSELAVWKKNNEGTYFLDAICEYPVACGSADSGVFFEFENKKYMATGHSEGYIVTWLVENEKLFFHSYLNLRSENPVPSPFQLWNIRGVASWKNGLIITASEDGDLCLVNSVMGVVVHRQKYHSGAERGINDISLSGNYLLLANCSVGSEDRNIWLYGISEDEFTCFDSKNLIQNINLEQVFSFNVESLTWNDETYFFATTQEGLLWFGKIEDEKLIIIGSKKVSSNGGAALTTIPFEKQILSVCYDIYLFNVIN